MSALLTRLLQARPLHFLLGGWLLFVLREPSASRRVAEPVRIEPQAEARLRAGFTASLGREPTPADFAAALRQEQDDEVLFREALANGLIERDAVARQRLALNMRFLEPESSGSDEELAAKAIALDMHRNDLVVRRRLVQLMEFALADVPADLPVSAEEAQRMYGERRAELLLPERWRIRQVYFSAERRGELAATEARAAADSLHAGKSGAAAAAALGDPVLGGHVLPLLTANQLEGQFGSGFAEAVARCPLLRWCAPVMSGFGAHAVLVEEHVAARLPGLEEPTVRARIEADVRRRRAEQRLLEGMQALRLKYGVAS